MSDERIAALEAKVDRLETRLRELEEDFDGYMDRLVEQASKVARFEVVDGEIRLVEDEAPADEEPQD